MKVMSMATKKKTVKKTKKVTNGHNKNGHTKKVTDDAVTLRVFPDAPEVSPDQKRFDEIDARLRDAKPDGPALKEILHDLKEEMASFRDAMVNKYACYYGHDLRRNVAWYMEQFGLGILSDMERVKAKERQKLIAENQAKELASQTAEK